MFKWDARSLAFEGHSRDIYWCILL